MYMHIVYIQYTLCEVLNEVPTEQTARRLLNQSESNARRHEND